MRWTAHVLGVEPAEMLQVENEAAGDHRYVAFEYTGPGGKDYLGEAGGRVPQRGAHATASDGAIGYLGRDGKRHLVLIEWKYSEEYRYHRLSADLSGKRLSRYGDKLFTPNGPVRADLSLSLSDFLREPFYQLVRQQMLAWQIERDPQSDFDEASVLHLSPRGNQALHHITAPSIAQALELVDGAKFCDAFEVYRAALSNPERFVQSFIEDAFSDMAIDQAAGWYSELAARYSSLCFK